jgi:hypothetical protein
LRYVFLPERSDSYFGAQVRLSFMISALRRMIIQIQAAVASARVA